jgi:uncharacterized protein YlzI (FlbEa/FlbD family)
MSGQSYILDTSIETVVDDIDVYAASGTLLIEEVVNAV